MGWVGLLCLFLSSCQPYPDQEKPIHDFRTESVDFGTKRELKIASFTGDRNSLRIEFNQPLKGWTLEGRKPSFQLSFEPEVSLASVTRVGAATVEARFATTLPPAHTYSVTVAPGWRALTGAAFMRAETLTWKTENLESVDSHSADPVPRLSVEQYPPVWSGDRGALSLKFSHHVDREELRRHLKGLSPESYTLRSRDGLTYDIERWNFEGSSDSPVLTVLEGLTSLEGAVLDTPLVIELDSRPKVRVLKSQRGSVLLDPRETVLSVPFPEKAVAATWALDERQLMRLLALPAQEWGESKKFAEELRPPVYQSSSKKSQLRTRFLPQTKKFVESRRSSAFLLRVTKADGSVSRWLIQRTGVTIDGVALNGRVHVFADTTVATPTRPRMADVSLFSGYGKLLHRRPQELGSVGELSGDWTEAPCFVSVKWQEQSVVYPLLGVEYRPTAPLAGTVWTDRTVYRPAEKISYKGLWWAQGPRGRARIFDSEGDPVLSVGEPGQDMGQAYQGTVEAPLAPGRYTLVVGGQEETEVACRFAVSERVGRPGTTLTLTPSSQADSNKRQGRYQWDGPGADQVEVRARLSRFEEGANGWSRIWPTEPTWESLEVTQEDTLEGGEFQLSALPKRQGRSLLSVHLTDRRSSSVSLADDSEVWGEVDVTLKSVDLNLLSDEGKQALFTLKFPDKQGRPVDEVDCHLLKYQDGSWVSLSQGPAISQDGDWLWTSNLSEDGYFRLSVSWGKAENRQSAQWSYSVAPEGVEEYPPLLERSKPLQPKEPLTVSWNGSAKADLVWLFSWTKYPQVIVRRRLLPTPERVLASFQETLDPHQKELSFMALGLSQGGQDNNFDLRFSKLPVAVDDPRQLSIKNAASQSSSLPSVEVGQTIPLPLEVMDLEVCFYGWERRTWRVDFEDALSILNRNARAPLQNSIRSTLRGPEKTGTKTPPVVTAPSRPGEYILSLLALDQDQQLSSWSQAFQVTEKARWSTLMPPRIRAQDQFSAGIEYVAAPAGVTSTGATASVELDSALLPNSYLATAILVKPALVDRLLFHYTAPRFLARSQESGQKLAWELGVEGKVDNVEVELPYLASEVTSHPFRSQVLKPGDALRFNVSSLKLWGLSLERIAGAAESSKIMVEGIADAPLSQTLDDEHKRWDYFGSAGLALALRLERGAPVKVTLERLEPELQENRFLADSLYLLRSVRDWGQTVRQVESVVAGDRYLISYHLIAPTELEPLTLHALLPGAAKAVGCWLSEGESLSALSWKEDREGIEIALPSLGPGEHQVLLGFEAVVEGNYRWPPSTISDAQGKLQAQSLESRFIVESR